MENCAGMPFLDIWWMRWKALISLVAGPFLFTMRQAKNWFTNVQSLLRSCNGAGVCVPRNGSIYDHARQNLARSHLSAHSRRRPTMIRQNRKELTRREMHTWLILLTFLTVKCRNLCVWAVPISRSTHHNMRPCSIHRFARDIASE